MAEHSGKVGTSDGREDKTLPTGFFPNDFRRYLIVTGGVGKGGILVRKGEDFRSPPASSKLATGSLVRAVQETETGRLLYELLSGSGPRLGWVSIRVGDKDLLSPADEAALEEAEAAGWRRPPRKPERMLRGRSTGEVTISRMIADMDDSKFRHHPTRPMRVCCFCGGYSNRKMMQYQTAELCALMDGLAFFYFLDGDIEIHDDGLAKMEPSAFGGKALGALTEGRLLRNWFESDFEPPLPPGWTITEHVDDMSVKELFLDFEDRLKSIEDFVLQKGPFDVLLGFSTGCVMITQLTNRLLKAGQQITWHLNVLFNPMFVRDERYRHEPLPSPHCIQIFGRNDPMIGYTKDLAMQEYVDPVVIEHDGGHALPKHPPDQRDAVYRELVEAMRHHCGY